MARGGYPDPQSPGASNGNGVDRSARRRGFEAPSFESEDPNIFGRTHGDHERLFPRYTNASAARADEMTINGKAIAIWDYAQLEALNVRILRQRANDLRDVLGEHNVPPMPSAQAHCMIKWILHVQNELIGRELESGRHGRGSKVPAHFLQDAKEHPIKPNLNTADRQGPVSFGPRTAYYQMTDHNASRDHYDDLLEQKKEFAEVQTTGIVSLRPGGEGRRPLSQKGHMENYGISTACPVGIETLKTRGEGRRHLTCADHVKEQQDEAYAGGVPASHSVPGVKNDKCSSLGYRSDITARSPHVSDHHMRSQGFGDSQAEPSIGGERRRHIASGGRDHMINHGTADSKDTAKGRRAIDIFKGPGHGHNGSHDIYNANWKRNPARLMGTSLIV